MNNLYEKFNDGVEICWGFNNLCQYHGDCNNCPKINDYNNSFDKEDN